MILINPYRFVQSDSGGGGEDPDYGSDPLWAQVKSLMRLDTAGFPDLASGKPNWSGIGAPVLSRDQTLFGNPTLKLDGSSLLVSTLTGASAGLSATVDVTVEVFFYPTRRSSEGENNDYQRIVSMEGGGDANMVLMRTNGGPYQMVVQAANGDGFIANVGSPNLRAWNHIVLQRKSNQWQFLANGTLRATRNNLNSQMPNVPWALGAAYGDGTPKEWLTGFMSNFRLTVGAARYADGYTVPTAPFPNRSDSNR